MKGIVDKPQFDTKYFEVGECVEVELTSMGSSVLNFGASITKVDGRKALILECNELRMDLIYINNDDGQQKTAMLKISQIEKGYVEIEKIES